MRFLLGRYSRSCALARPVRLRLRFVWFCPADIAFRAGSSAGIGFGARCRPSRSRISSEISAPSANATEESRTKRDSDRRVRTKRKNDRSSPHQARFQPALRPRLRFVQDRRLESGLVRATDPHEAEFHPKSPHQAQMRPKNPAPSANATEVARTKRDSDRRIPNQAQMRPKWPAPSEIPTEESRTKRKCDRSGIAHGWSGYLNRASSALISCLTRGTGFGLGPGVCLSGEFSEAAV